MLENMIYGGLALLGMAVLTLAAYIWHSTIGRIDKLGVIMEQMEKETDCQVKHKELSETLKAIRDDHKSAFTALIAEHKAMAGMMGNVVQDVATMKGFLKGK